MSKFSDVNTIRDAAERIYNVQFGESDKLELCSRLQSIERNKELSDDIGELSQQFILQPGGTQYLKYTETPELFFKTEEEHKARTQIDISEHYLNINYMCENPNKTNIDSYNLALKYGLGPYVSPSMTKTKICTVMNNYIKLVQEGRKL